MLINEIEETNKHHKMYVPAAITSSEINVRLDMKDGLIKINHNAILDEDGNGIPFRGYMIGYNPFYGDIGMYENTSWIKLLYVPFTKHEHITFMKLTVCSIWLRGDALANFSQAVSMASPHGIIMGESTLKITFGRASKTTRDKQNVTTRPAQFTFVKPEGDEPVWITQITQEFNQHLDNIKKLSTYTSGHNLIMTDHPDANRDIAVFKREKEAAFAGVSSSYYSLPEGSNGSGIATNVQPSF